MKPRINEVKELGVENTCCNYIRCIGSPDIPHYKTGCRALSYFYIFIERTKLCSNLLCKHSDVGGCSTTTIMIRQPSHTQ